MTQVYVSNCVLTMHIKVNSAQTANNAKIMPYLIAILQITTSMFSQ